MNILNIWTSAASELLIEEARPHQVLADRDALGRADVAFGQPEPARVIACERLKWVHLTTAGYTAYDRADVREALRARAGILTNSSSVFDEPCAEHVLMMMLAWARQFPTALADQLGGRGWTYAKARKGSRLLVGQTALLVGYGAIGRRLAELLAPLRMKLIGVRREPRGDEGIEMRRPEDLVKVLPEADHVINILPANASTAKVFDAAAFAAMKSGAVFHNIGRGTTVDQTALMTALGGGKLAAAMLDVTDPEPLPVDHPLWTTPNCHITPHSGGGHVDENERLMRHFLGNLRRYERGEPMVDRVY